MSMRISKRRKLRPAFVAILAALIVLALMYPFIRKTLHPDRYIKCDERVLTISLASLHEGEVIEDQMELTRGTKVTVEEKGTTTSKVSYNGTLLEVPNENLASSLSEVVDIEYIYPRKTVTLRTERGGPFSDVSVAKGEALKVVSVKTGDLDPDTGEIAWFEVEKNDEIYYVAGTNMETTKKNALKVYAEGLQFTPIYDSLFGDDYSQEAYINAPDFRGSSQPNFEDNPLPDNVQAVHINLDLLASEIDDLIELKNTTGLNAVVIALKGVDGKLFYESEVPAEYLNDPDAALSSAVLTKQQTIDLIKRLHNEGFYVIGRMETFADSTVAQDHPEWAITYNDGTLAYLSESYWLSCYSRDAWMYNGALAKEFAEMGCNEVQFDFCRFPDGGSQLEALGQLDFQNDYNETKVEAVQGFLFYIREELEPLHVYTAADMYSGPVLDNNDYDIGHYYPAIAAAANVVDPMLYLDTFTIELPDTETSTGEDTDEETEEEDDEDASDSSASDKAIVEYFTKSAYKSISSLENPAQLRIWLQGYGDITGEDLAEQIRGIMAGGGSGYEIWTDRGWSENLIMLKDGFIETKPSASDTTE